MRGPGVLVLPLFIAPPPPAVRAGGAGGLVLPEETAAHASETLACSGLCVRHVVSNPSATVTNDVEVPASLLEDCCTAVTSAWTICANVCSSAPVVNTCSSGNPGISLTPLEPSRGTFAGDVRIVRPTSPSSSPDGELAPSSYDMCRSKCQLKAHTLGAPIRATGLGCSAIREPTPCTPKATVKNDERSTQDRSAAPPRYLLCKVGNVFALHVNSALLTSANNERARRRGMYAIRIRSAVR